MTQFFRRFGTIRWKLTGSFMLVALFLALTLIAILVGVTVWFFNSNILPNEFASTARQYAVALKPEFEDPEGNPKRLLDRLQVLITEGPPVPAAPSADETEGRPETTITVDSASGNQIGVFIALLDPAGRVITTTESLEYQPHSELARGEPDPATALISQALSGITETTQLGGWSEPDRQPIAVAPVVGASGEVLGVVYLRGSDFPSLGVLFSELPATLLWFIVPWLAISAVVGMVYAWLAGRGFSRRLKRLTVATAALAQGDLSQRVQDNSADEIGQLAQQFNTMANQLTESMRALRLLADKNAQLAEQAAQLATVEERNRLARELHDSVSQELFSLTMLSAATERLIDRNPTVAAAQLGEIQSTAQRALQETRSLIFALRPAMLDDRGLGPSLRDLVAGAEERQGLSVDLHIVGERRLPLDYEQALFRIVQEALANVVRHSGVRAAEVDLCYNDEHVALTVRDGGRGFDVVAPRNIRSVGLHSMHERATALSGTFGIESKPETGTCINVVIPCVSSLAESELNHGFVSTLKVKGAER